MILCIDTSSAITVAVLEVAGDGAVAPVVRAQRTEFTPRGHAERLSVLIREVLAEAGASRPERIVVGTGPAPFTGLRVGLVTARALAFAWGIECDGVCSLDGMGAALPGEASRPDVTVVGDARRKEVYWAAYRDGVRVSGPDVGTPASVPQGGIVIGRGALLYPGVFPNAVMADPDPARLVAAALAARRGGTTELSTEPLYLRRPDVHGVPA